MANFQIDKLDDTNYDGWKMQMKSILIHQELWPYTSDTVKCETADEKEKWKNKDSKALALITLQVKPVQLIHIRNCVTSSEAWLKLEGIYQPKGPVRKVSLFKELIHTKIGSGQSIKSHVCNFFNVTEKLKEMDIVIPEEVLTIMLLCSLPDSYENFIVAIESRDELPKLSTVKIKILEEEQRRGEKDIRSIEQQVLAVKSKPKHFAKHRFKCYNCGKRGHFANSCVHKKPNEDKPRGSSALYSSSLNCIFGNNEWCLDSGATSHMSCNRNYFTKLEPIPSHPVQLAADKSVNASGIGIVKFTMNGREITMNDVLYVPELRGNFVSVSKAVSMNNSVYFYNDHADIVNSCNEVILKAEKRNDLFIIPIQQQINAITFNGNLDENQAENTLLKWHQRYGHLNFKSLLQLYENDMVIGLNLKNVPKYLNCVTCFKSKINVKAFPKQSSSRTDEVLCLVHTDICGPMRTQSVGGARYFVTFIDDFSRKIHVHFMKTRDEVFSVFREFKNRAELQTGHKLKMLRSDNGKEYLSSEFTKYLKENGIQRQLSVEYTPQQNGVAERANRTIVEMARCMLLESELPEMLWAEAVNTAVYLRNRSPTKVLNDITPYELWFKRKPVVNYLRVFGSKAVVLNKRSGRSKFLPKGEECVMVGYSEESKAYRLYKPGTRTIIKSRDVIFMEQVNKESDGIFTDGIISEPEKTEPEAKPAQDEFSVVPVEEESKDDISLESTSETSADLNNKTELNTKTLRSGKEYPMNFIATLSQYDDPVLVEDALSRPDADKWRESMQHEYDTLIRNGTWELVDLPPKRKAIGCKWVFHVKYKQNGSIERYKSRLVAKGCSQRYGVDYTETFSPVVRYATIRMILALAAEYKLLVHQMDVTSAYLNGELQEEIYMSQPEFFVDRKQSDKVCKLKKSLYGLKQSGREWNSKLDSVLKAFGFMQCNGDKCVYTMKNNTSEICIIAVYVDDLIIACVSHEFMNRIKQYLREQFEIVDKGKIHYCLGIEIDREGERGAISIHQTKHTMQLLNKMDMLECRNCYTPLDAGTKLTKCDNESCVKINESDYQSLVGSLMYLAISTRPDILHSVSKLSQFNKSPHVEHMVAAKHLLRYMKNTSNSKLTYQCTGKSLYGYVDADWGANIDDRKSYTGYVFYIAGSAFSWESKKQTSVALSTTEAEYMALAQSCKEATYLREILMEMGFHTMVNNKIILYNDNLSAQQLVKNPVYHQRSKHIDIRYHYTREIFERGIIDLAYIQTNDMVADILTKNLYRPKHKRFFDLLGMKTS